MKKIIFLSFLFFNLNFNYSYSNNELYNKIEMSEFEEDLKQ